MSDKGGSQNAKSTTTTEPWSGVQPFLKGAYKDASNIYNQGPPAYYGGQTVAPLSGYTTGALDTLFNRGQQGSEVGTSAQGAVTDTLSGDYLNSNPHLQGAINAAQEPLIQNYQNSIAPGIDSMFSSAGRYASDPDSAHAQMTLQGGEDLTRQLGNISSQMSYQNYGDERNRMMQGALMAPSLAGMDYTDIQAMGQEAGQGFDQHNQALINADIDKWNYEQNSDWNMVNDYLGLLNANNYGSSTTVAKQPQGSTFGNALGGAAGGAMAGSVFGPWGTAIGGGLGLLSGLF